MAGSRSLQRAAFRQCSKAATRPLTTSQQRLQRPGAEPIDTREVSPYSSSNPARSNTYNSTVGHRKISSTQETPNAQAGGPPIRYLERPSTPSPRRYTPSRPSGERLPQNTRLGKSDIEVSVDGKPCRFSPVVLRDTCECPSCVDPSTKQKLFSTADIPLSIGARSVAQSQRGSVTIKWDNDLPGYGPDHWTSIEIEVLRGLMESGIPPSAFQEPLPARTLWDAHAYQERQDIDYEAYMQDDAVLLKALRQLHSHGLLFLTNVPESENSVAAITERIGPVKNTFYGYTWDVRSVPQAKNVAYTSQDLGFHMDLLYMEQPPHLQFLHCIRSSSVGGASLFTDSYKAASDLYDKNMEAFDQLSKTGVNFHYNHADTHLYRQSRPVFELREKRSYLKLVQDRDGGATTVNPEEWLEAISWSPPFQAPFSLRERPVQYQALVPITRPPLESLNLKINSWHTAAREFGQLIHRPKGIYERLMKPGECVLFDNRRVLHARRAFEVGDMARRGG